MTADTLTALVAEMRAFTDGWPDPEVVGLLLHWADRIEAIALVKENFISKDEFTRRWTDKK